MRRPEELTHLSASCIAAWEECPQRWAAGYLEGIKGTPNIYAEIGTAVHEFLAAYLSKANLPTHLEVIPPEEYKLMLDYAGELNDLRTRTIGVEKKITFKPVKGAPPILGYLDWVGRSVDGSLVIMDHKTNRRYETTDEWRAKIQPQIYALSKEYVKDFRGFPRTRIRIGYVNLGTSVEWEHDPSTNGQIIERIERAWEGMKSGQYPATVNEHCGNCPGKDICEAYRQCTEGFSKSVADSILPTKALSRWQRLKVISKLVDEMLKEAESRAIAELTASGATTLDGYRYELVRRNQRSAEFMPVWETLCRLHDEEDPEVLPAVLGMAPDLFTVKVGGLDKLLRLKPELKPHVTPLIVTKPSQNETIDRKKVS